LASINSEGEFVWINYLKQIKELNIEKLTDNSNGTTGRQKLAAELEKVSFNDFTLPLVGNTEAQIMKSEDVKALLARQVMEPVRFYDSIATIPEFGVDEVIEIKHTALSKKMFAKGSVTAAQWLNSVDEPRLYSMKDVLGIE